MLAPLIVAFVLGVVLLRAGLRRRAEGDTPVCRRCDFDLSGITPLVKCPECGADLALPKAVRVGAPRRRPAMAWAGAALLLAALTTGGVHAYRTLTMPGWDSRVPPWWLAEVEMRVSSGERLRTASIMLVAIQNPSLQDSRRRGCIVAFHRLASSLKSHEVPLELVTAASVAANEGWVSDEQIEAAIIDGVSPYWPPNLGARFLPLGWEVRYRWETFDASGAKTEGTPMTYTDTRDYVGPARIVWTIEATSLSSSRTIKWQIEAQALLP